MQIIPVIDIRKGQVVHARGGHRAAYPPLQSVITRSTDIKQVLTDFLQWAPFRTIYIADLDAIENGQQAEDLYRDLVSLAGSTTIWLDAGIKMQAEINLEIKGIKWVLGSETLTALSMLKQANVMLSLDHKQQRFLGMPELLIPDCWTTQMIVMNLDKVGSHTGPAIEQLKQFRQQQPKLDWYAAGGVRTLADIDALKAAGAAGVLIASALHSGKLDQATVTQLLKAGR